MLFVCKWKRSGFKFVIVVTWSHHRSSSHRYKIQVTQLRIRKILREIERERERAQRCVTLNLDSVGQQDDRSSHRGSTLSNTADHSFICSHIFANRTALNLGLTHASAQITNSNWMLIKFWPRNEERQQHFSSLTKPSGQAKRGKATSKIVKRKKNVNKLHEICKFRWWTWKKTRQRLHNFV